MKISGTNIRVSDDVHKILVDYLQNGYGKIGKFTELAILEKIEREKNKEKK